VPGRDDDGGDTLAAHALAACYAATLILAALDYGFGISLRATFIDAWPALQAAWYNACLGCGLIVWRWPRWSRPVAATESAFVLAALILVTGLRVLMPSDAVLDGVRQPVGVVEIVNVLVSGSAAWVALQLDVSGRSR